MDLNREKDKITIFTFTTLLFYGRRILLVFAVIYYPQYMIYQLMGQTLFSLGAIIFIGHYWPYDSRFTNMMEVFSEVCTIFVLYTVIYFSDFATIEARHYSGYVFIAIVSIYISIHLYFMMRDSYQNVKTSCKRKCC